MRRKIKILFLAANPHDRTRLELDREFGRIREALRRGKYRDAFQLLEPEFNTRIGDFTSALLTNQPDVVHFCGHGAQNEGIVFEREDRYSRLASTEELTTLFKELQRGARLVFLNACHTKEQAKTLGQMFDYTIGTSGRIEDRAAGDFAGWFYRALADGATVSGAFHAARAAGERIGEVSELLKKIGADDSRPFILQVLKQGADKPVPPQNGGINITLSDTSGARDIIAMQGSKFTSRHGTPDTRPQKIGRRNKFRGGDD